MWPLVPITARLYGAVALVVLAIFARLVFTDLQLVTPLDWAGAMISAVGAVAVTGTILGRARWAWRLPCLLGMSRWYPDLNGIWRGAVLSSFREGGEPQSVEIEMTIDQRWSGIEVETRSLSTPHRSHGVIATPSRDGTRAVLWTHYVGEQDAPVPTDEQRFFGSSRLTFDPSTRQLTGTYWTNRAAHILGTGGTAGSVVLARGTTTRSRAICDNISS